MLFNDRRISAPGAFPQNFSDCLQTARNLFNRARKMAQKSNVDDLPQKLKNEKAEELRWYMLPRESHELLLGHSQNVKNSMPFDPSQNSELSPLINHLLYHRTNSLSALDVKRYQQSRSLPESPQNTKISISPPVQIVKNSQIESTSPQSPIVRFSLGEKNNFAFSQRKESI